MLIVWAGQFHVNISFCETGINITVNTVPLANFIDCGLDVLHSGRTVLYTCIQYIGNIET